MRSLKTALFSSLFIACLVLAAAHAQDWSGPYTGLQAGYGWGDTSGDLTNTPNAHLPHFSVPYDSGASGAIGGAHIGLDWQFGPWVVGAVGDAQGADIGGGVIRSHAQFQFKTTNDFDASIRARGGFTYDRLLFYGTGGLAWGSVKTQYSCPSCFNAPGPFATTDGFRMGWTIGAGVDVAIDPRWSAGVEYRYTELGSKGFSDSTVTTSQDNNSFTFNAVTLGVSYHFMPLVRSVAEPAPIVPAAAPMPVAPPIPAPIPMPPPRPQAMTPPAAFIVYFDFNKYSLTREAREILAQAADTFHDNGFARIELTGYTDSVGGGDYNMRLSRRRADAVSLYLERRGVPREVMDVEWRGKADQRVPTPEGVRERQNRRVEIVMP
jgi:outer membrane immunogenic protein